MNATKIMTVTDQSGELIGHVVRHATPGPTGRTIGFQRIEPPEPPEPDDSDLVYLAYPDGDPYADTIRHCRHCGLVVRRNTSTGQPSVEHDDFVDAYDDDEVLADPYDADCECGHELDVYEVWTREYLLERIERRKAEAD